MVRDLERSQLENWAKDVKIFVSHVNAHQKVTSAEEEFNNQVDNVIAYEVKAPVALDTVVGKIEVYKDGVLADTVNVVAAETVERASFGDYFVQIADGWNL